MKSDAGTHIIERMINMIFITGDTHGELEPFLNRLAKYDLTPNDTVIVCGDFGFDWGDPYHNAMLKELSRQNFTIAFADGNHENFDFLYIHPEETWHGGRIHRVEQNVIHLMRGQIFEFEGKSFFTFGGAYSRDKYMRHPGVSWWEQEIPNSAEYRTAASNLEKVNYSVDYVLTHQSPERMIRALGHAPDAHDRELTGYLDWLYDNLDFKKWFAGHWHVNRSFDNGRMNILLDEVVTIE